MAMASVLALSIYAPAPVVAEPLPQAVADALSHHPGVVAAVANREAIEAEKTEVRSRFFPQVSLRGTGGRNYADNSTSRGLNVTRGAGYSWLWEGTVTVTQHIWNGFETEKRVDAAEARQESAVFTIADVQEELGLRAVIAYLDVLRAQEALALLQEHGIKIDGYINRIKAMVEAGAADESMIVQATDIRAQLANSIVNSESQLRVSLAGFAEVVGRDPQDKLLKPVPALGFFPETVDAAVTYAVDHHPVIKAAALQKSAYERELEAEKASIYPDFTGELSYYGRDQADLIGGEVRDAKAVVRMNWDYGLGGAYNARVKRTMYRKAESRARMEELKRQIEREILVAYSDRQAAMEQVAIQKERLELNRELLNTYESQFEAARVNLFQLLQTDNALFNARMAVLNGEYRLLASQFAVLASMGRLLEALNIVPAEANDRASR